MNARPASGDNGGGTAALAACGLAGAVVFTASWVIAGFTTSGFSFVHNDTSDLGALSASHATPYNIGVSFSGLLTIGVAVAIFRAFGRRRAVVASAILVGIFSAGQFVDGLAREDCAVSVNRVCRAAEKAGTVSTHHKIHNLESLFTFSALLLAPLVLGLALRSLLRWRRLAWWSLAAAAVQLVCLPIFLAMYSGGSNGQGVVEIIELTAGVGWIAALSLAIFRETRSPHAMS